MFPKYFYQCVLLLVCYLVIFFVGFEIVNGLTPTWLESNFDLTIGVISSIALLIGIYTVTLLVNIRKGIPLSFGWLPNLPLKKLFVILCLVILYTIGKSLIVNSLYPFEWNSQPIISVLSMVLIWPVLEELVFRGIFLKGLLQNPKYPAWLSILVISLLFALVHFGVVQQATLLYKIFVISNAFVMGLIMSCLFYKTSNLGNVILVHGLVNAISLLLQYAFSLIQPQMQAHNILLRSVGIVLILCSLLAIALIIRNMNVEYNKEP